MKYLYMMLNYHRAIFNSFICFQIVASILIPFLIPAIKFVDKKALRDEYDDLAPLHSNEEDLMLEQEDLAVGKDTPEKLTSSTGKVAPIPDSKTKILKQKFKTVTLFGGDNDGSGGLNLFRAIFFFYTAPVTKFTTAMVNYYFHCTTKRLFFHTHVVVYMINNYGDLKST